MAGTETGKPEDPRPLGTGLEGIQHACWTQATDQICAKPDERLSIEVAGIGNAQPTNASVLPYRMTALIGLSSALSAGRTRMYR